jgi:uncharacterized protein (UPF0333 family)
MVMPKKLKFLLVRKGSIAIYFSFMVMAILLVVFTAVLAPMGVLMNTELYAAGNEIMLEANESIAKIDDANVRNSIYAVTDQALDAQQNNIEVNADIFQYGWVFIIILSGIVVFMFTRKTVEVQTGGFI